MLGHFKSSLQSPQNDDNSSRRGCSDQDVANSAEGTGNSILLSKSILKGSLIKMMEICLCTKREVLMSKVLGKRLAMHSACCMSRVSGSERIVSGNF